MNLIDVIKYEGDNRTFIWKHPREDFNTASQLVVHESQEAILFLNGQALDAFGPGRHSLETQNIPLLNKIVNLPSGGESPFHCEVYFVNLTEQLGIGWGTNSKVQFMEPEFHFPLSLGASGDMGLAVRNGRKLLVKLVGTEALLSQEKLVQYFKAYMQARIKTRLVQSIQENRLNIFELDAQLEALSEEIRLRLAPDFEPYGVELVQMVVTTLVRPEGDPVYEKFKELYFRQYADVREARIEQQVGIINQETEAKKTVIEATATADKRRIEGYTYQQERGFDVAEKVAANEAVGEFSNMGIGLGMMAGVAGPVGGAVGGVMGQTMESSGLGDAIAGAVVDAAPDSGPNARPPAGTGNVGPASTEACRPVPPAAGDAPKETAGNAARAAEGPRAKFCPECGHAFSGTEKFCPECGTRRG